MVVIVDEWASAGHFRQFFSDPDLQAFIRSVGAAETPPELTVVDAIASPDQFWPADQPPEDPGRKEVQ